MSRLSSRNERGFQLLVNGFLLIVLLVIVIPLWRVIMTSLTPLDVYMRGGVPFFQWPWEWSWGAYQQMLTHPSFPRATLNSVIITISGTALSLCLTVPLSYALSTRTLPGRRVITALILFTFLFHVGLIPVYLLVAKTLGWTDSFLAIIVPPAVGVTNTLVMMRFFEGIPEEIKEAARIDGANDIQVLTRIILPLSKPILLTIGLFYAVHYWNEFFTPMLYLNDQNLLPLPVLLRNILIGANLSEYVEYDLSRVASIESLKAAAVLLTMLPMVAVYPWIQRHFTKGTLLGGVKE
ncbi:MAG TPA: carbohydrate ABC transporter permease [Anaerolineae bacterium]|nr:carbohydrate ABC transporter permease [Anaerolineae bacterium]HOQ99938.1 carbohydrate ABC transporter permease [Anaerolineae bacterium]HPL26833.1 carbohydrate ABC transporter permease [Anaerolineae bacterium]